MRKFSSVKKVFVENKRQKFRTLRKNFWRKWMKRNFERVRQILILFTLFSKLAGETLWKVQIALKSRLFSKWVKTVFFNQGWLQIKVKFMSCLEIKVVFKMCQNCFFKLRLTSNQGKIHELPWNQGCFQNAPERAFYNYLGS